jgi:hypothetical protein
MIISQLSFFVPNIKFSEISLFLKELKVEGNESG